MGAWVDETSQAHVAREIGRSQSQVSRYVSGESLPEFAPRNAAYMKRGIPLTAWDELPTGAANTASQCEEPQAAQISSVPPFIGTTPEACPESASAA